MTMIKNKAEVYNFVKAFVNMVKTQFEKNVKAIKIDNGIEFLLKSFYQENGILHQRNYVITPQQIARIKRKHQHILNISRALMF